MRRNLTTLDKLNDEKRGPKKKITEPLINSLHSTVTKDIERHFSDNKRSGDNLSKRERSALQRLENRKDIVIKKADKGGATVILDSKDYLEEGVRQLSDEKYYEKLDHNPTKEHEEIVRTTIDRLVEEDEISEETAKKLYPSNSRTLLFYLLPKVHKEGCPGRPVVSSVKCHTEKISAFVDEKLRPIVSKLKSYIKDTSDFLRKIKDIGEIPKDAILVTMDVTGLYTNIDNTEGLEAMREALEESSQNQKPSANALTLMMRLILMLNNFVFNNVNYLQKMGTAMGTRAAPSYSNIFMGKFEDQFVYKSRWYRFIRFWGRYIDDIFFIWTGTIESLKSFLKHMNSVHPTIKFTAKYSKHEVNFLDTTVRKHQNGSLSTDVYQKPTDNPAYLHKKSAHDHKPKQSIPYSQALRLRRICQDDTTLRKRLQQYAQYFVACGYKGKDIYNKTKKVLTISQEEALRPNTKEKKARIPMVVTYNPDLPPVRRIVNQRWNLLHEDERLKKVFKNRPIIAYRKPKNLKDLLVRSKFVYEQEEEKGCSPCNDQRCSW